MNLSTTKYSIVAIWCFVATLFFQNEASAAHLIGGELTYECLGGNEFDVKLVLYRDCDQDPFCDNCADSFDSFAFIFMLNEDGNSIFVDGRNSLEINVDVENDGDSDPESYIGEEIPIDTDGLCTNETPSLCIARAEYRTIVNLPPREGGYRLIYQRCCRNETITNINFPGSTGATYEALVLHDGDGGCENSSPEFNNFPPTVICEGYPLYFDHSATDLDGDSLVYEICIPFAGTSQDTPALNETDFPFNIEPVDYIGLYTFEQPLGGFPAITIDSETGFLEANPTLTGQFVVAICVSEYRDGELLSTNRRDFQFNVLDCDLVKAIPNADAEEISPGNFQLFNCVSTAVNFDNISIGADAYEWDFGVEGIITDTSTLEFPTYIFPDTGSYNVTLLALDPNGLCNDTAFLELNIYPDFIPDFIFESPKCVGSFFDFEDQTFTTFGFVDSYAWDFGDGEVIGPGVAGQTVGTPFTIGTFDQPRHNFTSTGIQTVTLTTTNSFGCEDVVSYDIEVLPRPNLAVSSTTACIGEEVDFSATITNLDDLNIINIEWDFDDPSSGINNSSNNLDTIHIFNTPQDYTVTFFAEADNGCFRTIEIPLTIYPETVADAGTDQEICIGESVQLNGVSTGGVGADNTLAWQSTFVANIDSVLNPSITPDTSAWYYFSSIDPNGCLDLDSTFVTVHPLPIADAGEDLNVCLGDDAQFSASSVDELDITTWEWLTSNGLDNTGIPNPNLNQPQDTLTYFLEVTDINGCQTIDSLTVFPQPMVIASTIENQTICEGDSIILSASGSAFYEWTPSEFAAFADSSSTLVAPNETTNFVVTVFNECFSDQASVTVSVLPLPEVDAGADQTIIVGTSTFLDATSDATDFSWSPNFEISDINSTSPEITPLVDTTYFVTAISTDGCQKTDSVNITIDYTYNLLLPTAFTPNGDNLNDDLGLYSQGIERLDFFRIYNRWGQLLWEAESLEDKWDGTYRGTPQEIGVYVFHVSAKKYLSDNFVLKGNVTLLR